MLVCVYYAHDVLHETGNLAVCETPVNSTSELGQTQIERRVFQSMKLCILC